MQWYVKVLRQYADFNGRARRTELWMFALFNVIAMLVLGIIDAVAGLKIDPGFGVLGSIYSLAVLVPGLAVSVRRLHDTGRSGWWILLGLVPIVGGIVLLVWYCTPGKPENNRWGANPKTTPMSFA
ncbi:DUF805 domain-containing protein [Pseudonocardia acaciae]|uniref:DUF805 domain-containing protein n=1 Tax=Pseudonocardia acaciae TaxID=551276 RepID=UPI00048C00E5|nr:DUF805 domain-containing protein [Pseudonocardia acaciae]